MKITPFAFDDKLVRVAEKDGETWFVAKDVCEALGLGHHRTAVEKLDSDEKGVASIHSLGGDQETLIISESGLYALVLRCRDAMAPGSASHRFRKWVTAEVLPSIRKTGGYGDRAFDEAKVARIAGEAAVAVMNAVLPDMIRSALAMRGGTFKPGKTSGELWRLFGFPPIKGAAQWFGNRLAEMGCAAEDGGRGELGTSKARLFDLDKTERWIKNGGRSAVERYVAERRGQGVLKLVTK